MTSRSLSKVPTFNASSAHQELLRAPATRHAAAPPRPRHGPWRGRRERQSNSPHARAATAAARDHGSGCRYTARRSGTSSWAEQRWRDGRSPPAAARPTAICGAGAAKHDTSRAVTCSPPSTGRCTSAAGSRLFAESGSSAANACPPAPCALRGAALPGEFVRAARNRALDAAAPRHATPRPAASAAAAARRPPPAARRQVPRSAGRNPGRAGHCPGCLGGRSGGGARLAAPSRHAACRPPPAAPPAARRLPLARAR